MAALPPGPAGPLHGVPALPAEYLERDELGGLRAALLGAGAGAVGRDRGRARRGHARAGRDRQDGAGGRGRPRSGGPRALPGRGVLGHGRGAGRTWSGCRPGCCPGSGAAGVAPRSAAEGAGLLRQALADRQVLLVVDDVWSAAAAQAFRVTGPRGRVLYTTRDPAVLAAVGAVAERVDVLSAGGRPAAAGPHRRPARGRAAAGEADRVLAATGRVALAVALVGAAVRGGATWPQVAGELDRGGDTFLDHPYANTFKALQVGHRRAGSRPGRRLLQPGGVPAGHPGPGGRGQPLLGPAARQSRPAQVRADLQTLADRELLILDRDEIAFHDLQHSYLLLQADDLALLHDDLLAGYQALLAPAGDRVVAAAGRRAVHLGSSAVPPARRRGPRRGRQHGDRPGLSAPRGSRWPGRTPRRPTWHRPPRCTPTTRGSAGCGAGWPSTPTCSRAWRIRLMWP